MTYAKRVLVELLIVLLGLAFPLVLASLGAGQIISAAVTMAALIIWPGYLVCRLLWPGMNQLGLLERLALVPFLGVLAILAICFCLWFVLQQATLDLVYTVTLAVAVPMSLGLGLIALRTSETGHNARRDYHYLTATCAAFVVIAFLFGLAASIPVRTAAMPSLALYLDPQAKPAYNQAKEAVTVPIVVASTGRETTTTVRLTGAIMGRTIMTSTIELNASEQKRIELVIPDSSLASADTTIVDISVQPLNQPVSDSRMLRVRVRSDP
ncbi:MAG: hypothetical protein M3R24_37045 [Chloroflexota bacterium]|nr:hypothetical protein [Chloroflexota bacterium]PLS78208.1 MAG: hypothetical protein CYG59_19700 [Chloroflexota bacterium]